MAALWLPYRGLEGGLLSRYLRIMTNTPPSGSITGLEGGFLSPKCGHYGDVYPHRDDPLASPIIICDNIYFILQHVKKKKEMLQT